MKIYVITSTYSEIPLAEIRTDGKNIDWVIDNTEGHLPQMANGSLIRLKRAVHRSSHLAMNQPTEQTTAILRYSLTNGDVVEITTDGKTAILNGEILQPTEKRALMGLLGSGKLQVKQKADLSRPIPVLPQRYNRESAVKSKPPEISEEYIKAYKKEREKEKRKEKNDSVYYDSKIEQIDFSDQPYPEQSKNLFYLLKYGYAKGRRDV